MTYGGRRRKGVRKSRTGHDGVRQKGGEKMVLRVRKGWARLSGLRRGRVGTRVGKNRTARSWEKIEEGEDGALFTAGWSFLRLNV